MRHFDPGTGKHVFPEVSFDAFSRVFADSWEADNPSESDWKFECHELAF